MEEEKKTDLVEKIIATLTIIVSFTLSSILLGIIIGGSYNEFWNDIIIGFATISLSFNVLIIIVAWKDGAPFFKKKEKKKTKTKTDEIKLVKEKPYLYLEANNQNGEFSEQKCLLCNELVKESNEIVRCPECKSIMHIDCLEIWLDGNTTCPKCDFRLKKEN